MSEEHRLNEEEKSASSAGKSKKHTSKNTGVGRYLIILFIAAFLLLALAYLMQMRANEVTIGNLKESLSSFESLNDLVLENQNLHDEIDLLEDEIGRLEDEVDTLMGEKTELDSARRTQNNTLNELLDEAAAMQWFWQIDHAFTSGDHAKAEELIEQFESLALFDHLPSENMTETDQVSPAQRYKDICDTLFLVTP